MVAVCGQRSRGNDDMDMEMVEELLVPGVRKGDEAEFAAESGFAPNCSSVSETDSNRMLIATLLLQRIIGFRSCGTVNTLWKYFTGNTSLFRFSSQRSFAMDWHLGQ